MTNLANDRFLRACRRESVDRTPVWFMRQAGRYMPEYRRLREKHSLLTLVKTPELAAQVTFQPLQAFPLDAAIIFADILPLLEGMGLNLEFAAGEGPVIHNPVRNRNDVEALRVPPAEEVTPFTLEAIRLVRQELAGRIPLIGFSGAPFTLASYAIEGGSSRHYALTKGMIYDDPQVWHRLMEKLVGLIEGYLVAQVQAGAQALQLFDSWVGTLSPSDYRVYVLPYTRQVISSAQATGVPVIHFTTGTAGMLDLIKETGSNVISLDWRVDLDRAWQQLGEDVAVQGNLDPVALLAPLPELRRRAAEVLEHANGRPGYIFNLGHGILPQTPVEHVAALVEFVHQYRQEG